MILTNDTTKLVLTTSVATEVGGLQVADPPSTVFIFDCIHRRRTFFILECIVILKMSQPVSFTIDKLTYK